MILRNAQAKIVERSNVLPSGRIVKRIYSVKLFDENGVQVDELSPNMTTEDKAIAYLRSTGSSYRHIDVEYLNGKRNIYINNNTYAIDNGKTYTLVHNGKTMKNFRAWHRLMEFMNSGEMR